jgi:hypothetical protein
MKVRSKLFLAILSEVREGIIEEPFSVADVSHILGTSNTFLWQHSIDKSKSEPAKGTAYFIRVSHGRYRINPRIKVI